MAHKPKLVFKNKIKHINKIFFIEISYIIITFYIINYTYTKNGHIKVLKFCIKKEAYQKPLK